MPHTIPVMAVAWRQSLLGSFLLAVRARDLPYGVCTTDDWGPDATRCSMLPVYQITDDHLAIGSSSEGIGICTAISSRSSVGPIVLQAWMLEIPRNL